MLDNNKTVDDTPTWEDLADLFKNRNDLYGFGGMPTCPEYGVYRLGRVGELPTCSIGGRGHTMYK